MSSAATAPGGIGTRLTDEQREVFAAADNFARRELYPLARRMDDEEWWPESVFQQLGALGYLGITAPTELGGVGLDFLTQCLVGQALGRWNHAVMLGYFAHENLCLGNVLANACRELQRRYVPGMTDGSLVGALGLTEPGAGSDALGGMRTTARRDGDDYVLNGTKLFITNGPIADVVLVYAKTDLARGARGISAFLVETSAPGFSLAQKLTKMGMRGSQTGELVFDDCRVPAANLVGRENDGAGVVMNGLDRERTALAFGSLGMAERALELSISYARDRRQFGAPIGGFQLVAEMIAEMYTELEAMRSLALDIALEIGATRHGSGHRQIATHAAAAALFAGDALMRIVDRAVQIHGGAGYIWDTEVNRLYRGAKLFQIGAGTTEIRKAIIAENLLGLRTR